MPRFRTEIPEDKKPPGAKAQSCVSGWACSYVFKGEKPEKTLRGSAAAGLLVHGTPWDLILLTAFPVRTEQSWLKEALTRGTIPSSLHSIAANFMTITRSQGKAEMASAGKRGAEGVSNSRVSAEGDIHRALGRGRLKVA